ncbi:MULTISPECIES: hypothetical protein [unclassified Massilia]|uniref:hypothetical protein n=1 Tax=unclassified Massilia TaxID=2609279 RepID=UPI00177EE041|nr:MULTISPECIES: hypothetical protein [unclassified Massilia]MBD8531531.1 hypothetical protein [Massilia sp. CFBP 13647]MBD8673673.1 hypothetical protein [Massilia sp. CFBP 13721]
MSEQIARDKVVAKARSWLSSRKAKAAATGQERERAQSRHRQDGNELAEAVEKLEKGWAKSGAPPPGQSGST